LNVHVFDFEYIDAVKSGLRTYRHKNKTLEYYFLNLKSIKRKRKNMERSGALDKTMAAQV